MRLIPLNIQPEWKVLISGSLYYEADPRLRGEDMVEVRLANGLLISCGWYPEGQIDGCYLITVSEGLEFVRSPIELDNINDARQVIETMASHYSQDFYSNSHTSSTENLSEEFVA